jgi:hypothetical protein
MYFDVKMDDLANLNNSTWTKKEIWTAFTGHCLKRVDAKMGTILFTMAGKDLQLVMGKVVHNPHAVEYEDVLRTPTLCFPRYCWELASCRQEEGRRGCLMSIWILRFRAPDATANSNKPNCD